MPQPDVSKMTLLYQFQLHSSFDNYPERKCGVEERNWSSAGWKLRIVRFK
jgi:hypothetical protein